ncbi:MAG: CBS domain-containing protein, partial [Myxococcota bacterium]
MKVGELCEREVVVSKPEVTVRDAAGIMNERGVGALVVVDPLGRPLGIVTDRDVLVRCTAVGKDPARMRLRRLMSGPVVWTHEDSPLEAALEEMARLRVRRLPVVDARERLVGILGLDDVVLAHSDPDTPIGQALRANLGG